MFASCSFFGFSFFNFLGFDHNELPSKNVIIDKACGHALKELQKKYSIKMIGSGGSEENKKETMIAASYSLNEVLSKEQCRKLILDCADELLKQINQREDLKVYLCEVPFSYKSIEIRIFLRNPDRSDIQPPNICIVSLIDGVIAYKVEDMNAIGHLRRIEELYEDALKIVQTQNIEATPKNDQKGI